MNQDQIASHYRQTSARGTSPVGLVVKLYDAILEDFRRASDALAEGNVERRTAAVNHALLIIAELEGVLDDNPSPVIARQLRGFYSVTRSMIVEANVRASRERFEKLAGLYVPLRQAWQQVEQDVASGKVVLPENERSPRKQSISAFSDTQPAGESSNWNG
jgi:flagellar biosynthetic protein FliS